MKRYLPLIYLLLAIIIPYSIWGFVLTQRDTFDYNTDDTIIVQGDKNTFFEVNLQDGISKEYSGQIISQPVTLTGTKLYSPDRKFYALDGVIKSSSGEVVDSYCHGIPMSKKVYWTQDGKYVVGLRMLVQRRLGILFIFGGKTLYILDPKTQECQNITSTLNGKWFYIDEIVGGRDK